MKEVSILLKLLNIYAHNCHNKVARIVFMQDHEFLGEIYKEVDSMYDDVIERMIGLDQEVNLNEIHIMAVQALQQFPSEYKENAECFKAILNIEQEICSIIEQLVRNKQVSVGTEQLLGDICNKLEGHAYKIKQRIKK